MMNKNRKEHTEEFQKSIKKELYIETFQTDEDEFSPEKIESLVNLLEIEDPTDEEEIKNAQAMFEKQFLENNKVQIRQERRKRRWKQVAQVAAAAALVIIAADTSTQAVMDKSLFHMAVEWADHIMITPGELKNETEVLEFEEEEARYFSSAEEFDENFEDGFLVFSWMPDEFKLEEIIAYDNPERCKYLWKFYSEDDPEKTIELWIYEGVDKANAVFATETYQERYQKVFSNGINVTFCKNKKGYLAGFEHGKWWYLINTSEELSVMEQMIERMEVYEEE